MLSEYLTANAIDRPKHGLSAPIEQWLRRPLRGWAESRLCPASLAADGFDASGLCANGDATLAGGRDARDVWTDLMYHQWREGRTAR